MVIQQLQITYRSAGLSFFENFLNSAYCAFQRCLLLLIHLTRYFQNHRAVSDQAFYPSMFIHRYKATNELFTQNIYEYQRHLQAIKSRYYIENVTKKLPGTLFHLVKHRFDNVWIAVILKTIKSRYIYTCKKKCTTRPYLYVIAHDRLYFSKRKVKTGMTKACEIIMDAC